MASRTLTATLSGLSWSVIPTSAGAQSWRSIHVSDDATEVVAAAAGNHSSAHCVCAVLIVDCAML